MVDRLINHYRIQPGAKDTIKKMGFNMAETRIIYDSNLAQIANRHRTN
jgi:hypothetical protein